ncbi:Rrp15p-domain-containing protein [Kockovaella imperatae]|uniref:Rrp15p-domain-containing protein n=1 Tax=Kockovaella imperatae TaxID=4999 RepID=A0A1Y1UG43_9TREE|nr:Rrp15p-domain-containing protein [Kockovaella imperatae]ORX36949.1 Rrp15p-domain-containing protein [Kockovaella imperatae]
MSKPKSILKKPSGSASHSVTKAQAPDRSILALTDKGKGKAGAPKLRQSIPVKRARNNEDDEDDEEEDEASDGMDESGDEFDESEELDTDEEISRSKSDKGSRPIKKKKGPTSAETFGSTLTSLLSEPGPSKRSRATIEDSKPSTKQPSSISVKSTPKANPILSLSHIKLPPSKATLSLERRAARKVKQEKEEKEDRARVRDVVEGWTAADGTGGMEFEKGLRKVAQKGVIKLFNAILAASKASESAPLTLAAKAGVKEDKGRRKEKDNVLGRGGKIGEGKGLTSESFLDMVRNG